MGGGAYLLFTALSPFAVSTLVNSEDNQTIDKMAEAKNRITENRLYIPKIDINLPYATGDETDMENGAWWRSPSSGNPKDGGNFVLSAHRFVMGWSPGETVKRSPFYNIDKLDISDTIAIDYSGKRYSYIVDKKYSVPPTASEIEAPTEDSRLTLYSCGLGGASDKREVIIAKLDL
jgi:sortase A